MKEYILNLLKVNKEGTSEKLKTELVIFVSDLLVALLSLYVTLRILLGSEIQTLQMPFILKHCLVFALICFALFSWVRSYQGSSKYISMENIPGILGCAVLANLFYHPLMLLMGNLPPLTPIVNTVLFMTGLLLPRLIAPFWRREEIKTNTVELSPKIPVVVIGYNEQIGAYLRENDKNREDRTSFPYHLEGILLNHPLSDEDLAPPVPILGMVSDFVSIVQKLSLEGREPKRFLITQDSLNHMPLRHLLLKFQGKGILSLRFEVSPATHEVTLRPLHLEDLIGKARLESDQNTILNSTWQEVQVLFDSTRVLITGVHDPVVHQLANHIVGFYPKQLILVDPSEQALASLKVSFDQLYPDVECEYVLASITDRATMDRLIKTHQPQVIIHGDRVTHPDLVADNLLMAVQKNILSPLHLVQDIQRTEACLFVLINAQTPTRLTRLISSLVSRQIQAIDRASKKKSQMRFLVVNCSDVWNNLDSVTAFWEDQLNQGLNISIPSPDSYSYLLSAEEAARTILKAIVKALLNEKTKGQVLHLSGGEPSRFLDLIRSLSLLNGLIPEIDVKVKFSGEVIQKPSFEETDLLQSLTPGVMMGEINSCVHAQDEDLLIKLTELLEKGQTAKIVALLERMNLDEDDADSAQFFKLTG
ncbi:MAG: polysaccharide biosynthesis protein [Alphaproteobacteria bacterium]|jgi:FlaA1/EpsC-like NDP-sugar epimerase|nr:polysaccharide biosynthesis protein [Alphaproteobacteria bacterium]